MAALIHDNSEATHRFVSEFNESLAAAKLDALAILRDYVAGAESPSLPRDRERRLAASQVLRTQFLCIDQDGNVRDDRRRDRTRRKDADPNETRAAGAAPPHTPEELPPDSFDSPSMDLADVQARRDSGLPSEFPSPSTSDSSAVSARSAVQSGTQDPSPETQALSAIPAPLREMNFFPRAPT